MPIGRLPFLGGGNAGGGGGGGGGGTATIITGSTEIPDTQTVIWGALSEAQQQAAIDAGVVDPGDPTAEVDIPVVFGAGKAVCLVENDQGEEEFRLCSSNIAIGSPNTFLGFQVNDTSNGAAPIVVTMRGTRVSNPIVTGGVDLVAGQDVYLSHVAGEVTQNPTTDEGFVELRLGFALSANKFILANDFRIGM